MGAPAAMHGLVAGTPVLTPRGPVPVERLVPGDLVLAVSGQGAPFQPVVATAAAGGVTPLVRIRAGALADGAPQEDLLLPPAHALLFDTVLVAAGDLADGLGILVEPAGGEVTLVQVVLDGHHAVLASGAAVETALPEPDAPSCAPRAAPDGTLRALLAWRAEAMGWAAPAPVEPPPPAIGSYRARLEASALGAPDAPPPLPPRR